MTHSPHKDRSRLKVAMMQDGSRRAYALPIALHKAGALQVMYTDWYDRPGSLDNLLATLVSPFMSHAVSKLRTRKSDDLVGAPICSWPITTLRNRRLSKIYDSEAEFFLEVAQRDRALINKHNFHNVGLGETKCDEQGCRLTNDSYALNPRWIEASTPWGMRPALDWLAATARRKTLDP